MSSSMQGPEVMLGLCDARGLPRLPSMPMVSRATAKVLWGLQDCTKSYLQDHGLPRIDEVYFMSISHRTIRALENQYDKMCK